jgi:catechol 1,2-dioxygenase
MNLRGKFTTDATAASRSAASSRPAIRSRSPGRSAICCKAQGRHNMRPAHLHFLIYKPGFKTHISQVYLPDDPNIETDVQFGVTKAAAGRLRAPREREAAGARRQGPVVLARLHLHHGTRHREAAARADPGQSERPPRCGRNICRR